MPKKIFLASLIFLSAASCNQSPVAAPYNDGTMEIAGKILRLDVVSTDNDRQRGLSGRQEIGEGSGMLFVFEQAGDYGIWMKDMKFPIDIIWIYNNQVVDIESEAPIPLLGTTENQLPVYRSQNQADRILEVKSGWSAKHNLKVGDKVKINLE